MKRPVFLVGVLAALLLSPASLPADANSGCSSGTVRRLVDSFIVAYNHGNVDEMNKIFAREDRFQEYRVLPLERDWPESNNRESLLAYFKQRHQQADHFTLKRLEVGRAKDGGFYFRPYLERRSNDIRPWANGNYVPQKSAVTPNCKIKLFRIQWDGP